MPLASARAYAMPESQSPPPVDRKGPSWLPPAQGKGPSELPSHQSLPEKMAYSASPLNPLLYRTKARQLHGQSTSDKPGDHKTPLAPSRPPETRNNIGGQKQQSRHVLAGSRPPPAAGAFPRSYLVPASMSQLHRAASSPRPPLNFWTDWSTHRASDLTIHFELGIEEDLETHLNVLARYRRLGQYKKALETHAQYPRNFQQEPLIAIEQASILFSQGNYRLLEQIMTESLPWLIRSRRREGMEGHPAAILSLKWFLIAIRCNTHVKVSYEGVAELWDESKRVISSVAEAGSTELFIYTMCLELIAEVSTYSSSVNPFDTPEVTVMWENLYQQLVGEGKIWELADLVRASTLAFGAVDTWKNIFRKDFYSDDFFAVINRDWRLDEYDESTSVALLDILVNLALWLDVQLCGEAEIRDLLAMDRCLKEGDKIVSTIIKNDLNSMKTQQYARWLLAHVKFKNHTSEVNLTSPNLAKGQRMNDRYQMRYLDGFTGRQLWHSGLPIYLPNKNENPGWDNPRISDAVRKMIQAPLALARDLGDLKTEALCLKELIRISPKPLAIFKELGLLQKNVQEDMRGFLETLLASYLVADNKLLKDELMNFGQKIRGDSPPLLAFGFNVIMGSMEGRTRRRKRFRSLSRRIRDSMTEGFAPQRHDTQQGQDDDPYWDSREVNEGTNSIRTQHEMKRWIGVGSIISFHSETEEDSSDSDQSPSPAVPSKRGPEIRKRHQESTEKAQARRAKSSERSSSSSESVYTSGWETDGSSSSLSAFKRI